LLCTHASVFEELLAVACETRNYTYSKYSKKNEQFNSWRVGVHPNLLACERFKHPCFVCSLVLVAAVPWILEVSKRHARHNIWTWKNNVV
jgi:hypothetical protein